MLCWLGLQVGLFSLVQTKLPSYVTPCFPAVALLIGICLDRFVRGSSTVSDVWFRWSIWSQGIGGVLVGLALAIVAVKYASGHWELAILGAPLLIGAVWGVIWLSRSRAVSLIGVAVGQIAFCAAFFGWGTTVVDSTRQTDIVLDRIRAADDEVGVAAYRCLESSWVVYGGRAIIELEQTTVKSARSLERAASWSAVPRPSPESFCQLFSKGLIITTDEYLEELQARLPRDFEVVARCKNFLKDDELVLLERREKVSTATAVRDSNIR
jgi:4-amino-4-deoxy-L-arabinose transferase-like glycosyltransferase